MQMSARDMCQPTTEAACRRLALKLGMPFGGSSVKSIYFGCFGFSENGKAYFGGGGTETQKLQAMARLPGYAWTPLRLSSLDTDCLLLSNQAELQSNQADLASKLATLVVSSPNPNEPNPNPTVCSDFSYNDCPTANGCKTYGRWIDNICAGTWRPS